MITFFNVSFVHLDKIDKKTEMNYKTVGLYHFCWFHVYLINNCEKYRTLLAIITYAIAAIAIKPCYFPISSLITNFKYNHCKSTLSYL